MKLTIHHFFSTLFDAFGFLADCLKSGVEEACDLRGRGGFERIRSQGQDGPVEIDVYYKEDGNARPITCELSIGLDKTARPYVQKERLRQRRKGQKHGWPFSFLVLNEGKGVVWKGDAAGRQIDEGKEQLDLFGLIDSIRKEDDREESRETEAVELEDKRKLGIATLGSLKQHPIISAFRRFIEGWYLSYFTPDAARGLPLAGPQRHLNIHGDNLGNVVQFMEREHPRRFHSIRPGRQEHGRRRAAVGRPLVQRLSGRGVGRCISKSSSNTSPAKKPFEKPIPTQGRMF